MKRLNRAGFMQMKRYAAFVLLAGLIFLAGWGAGGGRVQIGSDPVGSNNKLPRDLDYSTVEQVYDALRQNYDGELDEQKLLDGLKDGLAQSIGDPYTEYFNAEAARTFDADMSGTFTGIGAELGKENNTIIIIAPLSGYPAERAGLKSKDVIVEIDGESAFDLSVSEAVTKIRGPKDTKVKLKVVRAGSQELNFEITREEIRVPSVEESIVDNNIGYLKISRFGEDTSALAKSAAEKFKNANVKAVILDLRSDPGGLLDASVKVSSLWLPRGKTVLLEKRGDVTQRTYESEGPGILSGIPTVVLINEGSASASEIVAGALKDNGAAKLMGTKSYGKGSVQSLNCLEGGGGVLGGSCEGSMLKVTIARWFTPNGKNIDKEGLEPDIKVERTDEDFQAGRDPQLDAAKAELNK